MKPAINLILLTALLSLCGCLNLKPTHSLERYFVLSSLPASPVAPNASAMTLGIGPVKLASYLFKENQAMRLGSNEIVYLSDSRWAERLDAGFQRVVAANLVGLLPTDRIRLSLWNKDDVALELYVVLERFDVDSRGEGVIVAWWRICSPGSDQILESGQFRKSRTGPNPKADPQGATALLSELAADFSRDLAEKIRQVPPASAVAR